MVKLTWLVNSITEQGNGKCSCNFYACVGIFDRHSIYKTRIICLAVLCEFWTEHWCDTLANKRHRMRYSGTDGMKRHTFTNKCIWINFLRTNPSDKNLSIEYGLMVRSHITTNSMYAMLKLTLTLISMAVHSVAWHSFGTFVTIASEK